MSCQRPTVTVNVLDWIFMVFVWVIYYFFLGFNNIFQELPFIDFFYDNNCDKMFDRIFDKLMFEKTFDNFTENLNITFDKFASCKLVTNAHSDAKLKKRILIKIDIINNKKSDKFQ